MRVERIPIGGRAEWLDLRRADVTASVVAAMPTLNVHPYVTPAQVRAEKEGLAVPTPDPESEMLLRGLELEEVAARMVNRLRPGWTIERAGIYLRATDLRLGATPDFIIDGQGCLQTKIVAAPVFRREWALGPPLWILLQNLTECLLGDMAFGAIGVLEVGDFRFQPHIFDVPRHQASEQRILDAVAAFWRDLDEGRPVPLDFKRDGELIRLMYPRETEGKIIDLTDNNRLPEIAHQHAHLGKELSMLRDQRNALESEVKHLLGDAEGAVFAGGRVALRTVNRKGYTVDATSYRKLTFAQDHREV